MDVKNPTQVFRSDCKHTRVTVEAALIHAAPTIPCNTASASVDANDLVAPAICHSAILNWNKLAKVIPQLKIDAIPNYKRKLFGNDNIARPPEHLRSQPAPGTPIAHGTRSQRLRRAREEARSSQAQPVV